MHYTSIITSAATKVTTTVTKTVPTSPARSSRPARGLTPARNPELAAAAPVRQCCSLHSDFVRAAVTLSPYPSIPLSLSLALLHSDFWFLTSDLVRTAATLSLCTSSVHSTPGILESSTPLLWHLTTVLRGLTCAALRLSSRLWVRPLTPFCASLTTSTKTARSSCLQTTTKNNSSRTPTAIGRRLPASSGRRPVSASKVVGREPEAESGRLGGVYEQFLGLSACGHAQAGKVIRLAVDHQAKVEEKPEVPKAGELRPTPLTWRREEVILTLRIEVSYEDTR
jgi:hypothetical protein